MLQQTAESVLKLLPVSDAVKADAWDAFEQSTSREDLTARLRRINIPDEAKAQLWDLKAGQPMPAGPPLAAVDAQRTPEQKAYGLMKVISTAAGPQYAKSLDAYVGGLKGVGSTAYNIGRMIPGVRSLLPEEKPEFLQPQNTAQQGGFAAEQVGEFFLPGGAVRRGTGAVEALTKVYGPAKAAGVLNLTGRAALEGVSAGAVTAAQTGGDRNAALRNAVLGGLIPIAGTALLKSGRKAAEKIEMSLIRPTQSDINAGFKVENITKHGLFGTLGQTAQKTHDKIAQLSQNLKTVLGSKRVDVDILDALQQAATELKAAPEKTMGFNSKIDAAVDFWLDELKQVAPSGKINLLGANDVKRSVGRFGAWLEGARDPDSGALERVSNAFYSKLRSSIENAAQNPGVRDINRIIGELIPIEQAVIRRLPIAERQNVLSLSDVILASGAIHNPSVLWLMALNKASKSGRFAKGLNAGAQQAAPIATGATRIGVGSVTAGTNTGRNAPQPK